MKELPKTCSQTKHSASVNDALETLHSNFWQHHLECNGNLPLHLGILISYNWYS